MNKSQFHEQTRDELEQRVAERTAELSEANIRLKAEIAERQHAEEVLSRYARRLSTLHHMDRAILAAESAGQIAQITFDQIRRLLACECLNLTLFNFTTQQATLFFVTIDGLIDPETGKFITLKTDKRIQCLRQGQHIFIENMSTLSTPPFDLNLNHWPNAEDLQTYLDLPLICRGQLIGSLNLAFTQADQFEASDIEIAEEIADRVAIAIEQLKLYNNLQQALQQEQATRAQLVQTGKLAAMGRLVASVAHELNNPLQAIYNIFWMLSQERTLSEKMRGEVDVALQEAQRMADLIARLRDTYRPVRRHTFRPESLEKVVNDVEQIIKTHLRRKKVQFTYETVPDLPKILGIRDQIKQVLLNLSLNAIDMMPGGGHLIVRTGHNGRYAFLQVEDNGPGIQPTDLPNIFDPFFSTKETGTGLGLTITYDIVQRHNGRIEVDSHPNQGTTFTVWLPMAPPLKN